MPHVQRMKWIVLIVFAVAFAAEDARSAVSIAIEPEFTVVAPGEEFTVDVALAEFGDSINGYDALVGYDPTRLELILPIPRSAGEGPLFKEACPQRFLNVAVSVFLTVLVLSYVMYVTDPSVAERTKIDRLHFTVPFVVAGALRYLQVILVEVKPGEPLRL